MTAPKVTLDRVAQWFDKNQLNYDKSEDRILTGFPGLGVSIVFDGEDDCWLRVFGYWMGTIPPSERQAVIDFTAKWNAEKIIPKVSYEDMEYEGVPEVAISGEQIGMVDTGYTDEQLAGFLDMALSGLGHMAEVAQEAFPAYAPNDEN